MAKPAHKGQSGWQHGAFVKKREWWGLFLRVEGGAARSKSNRARARERERQGEGAREGRIRGEG